MLSTQKIHWKSGHAVRFGFHHSLSFALFGFGFLLCFGRKTRDNPYSSNMVNFTVFRLI